MCVALALLTSAGCQTSGNVQAERQLPPFPDYARTVQVEPHEDEDALAYAARERKARVHSNKIILNLKDWYEKIRQSYGAGS